MTDPRETLARIRAQADAATDGPWAPWLDQDGAKHMGGLLMVGNAEAVIPDGEEFVDEVDVNPIAHVYTPWDRTFIAASITDVPRLVDALEKVLNLHVKAQPIPAAYGTQEGGDYCVTCAEDWPCPTVTAITQALSTA